MSIYTVRAGESVGDFVLNSCGDISAWSDCLDSNLFDTWVPSLYSGQVLQIPATTNTNIDNIANLKIYPANNFSVPNIAEQIDAIFELLSKVIPGPPITVSLPTASTIVDIYVMRVGEDISDCILNSTGDISNWSDILDENGFNEWSPILYPGQEIIIPSSVNMNLNNFRALTTYPANNNSVPDIYEQINAIFEVLSNNLWILREGFWIDSPSEWIDSDFWIDGD